MKKAILTTKVGMTQVFSEDGVLTPVTVQSRLVLATSEKNWSTNQRKAILQKLA